MLSLARRRARIARCAFAASVALLVSAPLAAHHASSHRIVHPAAPAAHAHTESVEGAIETLDVVDLQGGTRTYFSLRLADGSRLALRDLGRSLPASGEVVTITGRRNDALLFAQGWKTERATAAKSAADGRQATLEGTLDFLYADQFDADRCELVVTINDAQGRHINVALPAYPEELESGMQVRVTGQLAADGLDVVPSRIEILAAAPDLAQPAATRSNKVLTILLKYADTTTEPYTQANAQSVMFGASNSVSAYYLETSYGGHTLNGTVTPWLVARFNRPSTCDYSSVATEAMYQANQAGYATSQYDRYVYVFPSLPGCGWAGLGGGSQAWINQALSLLVVGHELGHTFGLGHASSLSCTGVAIGGTCTRSEYGDPAEIMGNQRAAHFDAPHKVALGYFPAGTVSEHKGGASSYTVQPIETAGASRFAVKVYSSAKHTYWIEYRQPLGTFDSALPSGITAGAYVHIAGANDYGCDTCVLDMAPSTTSFGDAALPVGGQFVDAMTGTTITAVSRTASALTVSVATPSRPTFADVPSTHWAYNEVEAVHWSSISGGCASGPLVFCPAANVTRGEMAVFLERAMRGSAYAFSASGTIFADVPSTQWAAGPIEQLYKDAITGGCATTPLRYCPDAPITRAEMAVLLLKSRLGSTYNPGSASGTIFADVLKSYWAAAWIEKMYQYGYTKGCSSNPLAFCPDRAITRAEMAVLLKRVFALPAPPV